MNGYLLFVAVLLVLLPHGAFHSADAAEITTDESNRKEIPGADTQKDEEDEWGEPEVEKPQTGRDEDARRRLMEMETWRKKLDAEKITKEREEAEKVRWEFSGKFKPRLNIRDNLHLNNPRQFWEYDESTYLDERFQLKIDAVYGPLVAVMLFDSGNFPWNWDWKEGSEGTLGRWSEFHTALPPLLRELFIQFTGRLVVQVGKKNVIVGNGGLVLEGPSDLIRLLYPMGQTAIGRVTLAFSYIAVSGGFRNYDEFRQTGPPSGFRNALIGIPNKLDGLLFSAEIKPGKNLTIEPYVLQVNDRGDFEAGASDLNLDKDFDVTTTPRDKFFEPLWIGTAISGKGEKISYTADLIYLTGSYTRNRDISAYAAMLRSDYRFESGFTTGLEFGMGSGNKIGDKETDDYKDFSGLWLCRDRRKFGNIFSEDLRAGFFLWGSNLSNVTFARVILEHESAKKLKTSLSVLKLWTTESVLKGQGPVRDWSEGMSTSTEETRDLGWEVDLNLDYELMKRLQGFIEIGYFIPGDVYQLPDSRQADPASEIVMGIEFVF